MLGLRCCAQAFSSCGEPGLLFVAVRVLLSAVASLVAVASRCGAWALGARASVVAARGLSSKSFLTLLSFLHNTATRNYFIYINICLFCILIVCLLH